MKLKYHTVLRLLNSVLLTYLVMPFMLLKVPQDVRFSASLYKWMQRIGQTHKKSEARKEIVLSLVVFIYCNIICSWKNTKFS